MSGSSVWIPGAEGKGVGGSSKKEASYYFKGCGLSRLEIGGLTTGCTVKHCVGDVSYGTKAVDFYSILGSVNSLKDETKPYPTKNIEEFFISNSPNRRQIVNANLMNC